MAFHRPVLWALASNSGVALQLDSPRSFVQALQNTAGEFYAQPLYGKSPGAAITTNDSVSSIAAGSARVLTPASMVGITAGCQLVIDQALPVKETVMVTSVTATTFTAVYLNAHIGTAGTSIAISGIAMPAAPTASPAPSAGQPAIGWWHLTGGNAKRSLGLEALPAAGTPYYPGGAYDQCYGLLIWTVTGCELEVIAH